MIFIPSRCARAGVALLMPELPQEDLDWDVFLPRIPVAGSHGKGREPFFGMLVESLNIANQPITSSNVGFFFGGTGNTPRNPGFDRSWKFQEYRKIGWCGKNIIFFLSIVIIFSYWATGYSLLSLLYQYIPIFKGIYKDWRHCGTELCLQLFQSPKRNGSNVSNDLGRLDKAVPESIPVEDFCRNFKYVTSDSCVISIQKWSEVYVFSSSMSYSP